MFQKRTVEEINTLYELEPDVCDVYVEGVSDKHFLDWYLRRRGFDNVTVYSIDVVDVPDEILSSNILSKGSNRSKVIALSCELARQQSTKRRVMCVVDRDSDDAPTGFRTNPFLYSTDGNSMELYAFTPNVVEKFLLIALAGFPLSAASIIAKMTTVLEIVFAIRLTNCRLNLGLEWISFCKYVQIKNLNLIFREDDFIRAYLHRGDQWGRRDEFIAVKNDIQRNLTPEISKRVRGHDLSELLQVIVRKLRKERAFCSGPHLEGCLMTALEAKDLESYPLFVSLERNANGT